MNHEEGSSLHGHKGTAHFGFVSVPGRRALLEIREKQMCPKHRRGHLVSTKSPGTGKIPRRLCKEKDALQN